MFQPTETSGQMIGVGVDSLPPVAWPLLLLVGLALGSFTNVLIARLPSSERSLFRPLFSACPDCDAPLRARDNIPLLSYLWLRGRCRGCRRPISVQYPLVEGAVAAILVASVVVYGLTLEALSTGLFLFVLLAAGVTDLRTYLLPHVYTLGGWVAGLTLAWLLAGSPLVLERLLDSLLVSGALFALGQAGRLAFGREALGFGDVLLVGMMASFLGAGGAVVAIYLAAVFGVVLYALIGRRHPERHIPFGFHLALAGGAVLLWGDIQYAEWIETALPWHG